MMLDSLENRGHGIPQSDTEVWSHRHNLVAMCIIMTKVDLAIGIGPLVHFLVDIVAVPTVKEHTFLDAIDNNLDRHPARWLSVYILKTPEFYQPRAEQALQALNIIGRVVDAAPGIYYYLRDI